MNERPRKDTRPTLSLEQQDSLVLNEIVSASDVSISWVNRQAIRKFIEANSRPIDRPYPLPSCRAGDGR
jgi:hypothetical protein